MSRKLLVGLLDGRAIRRSPRSATIEITSMPVSAPTPCRYPGCSDLVTVGNGYCPTHRRAEQRRIDERRGSAAARGYDSRWRKARVGYLRSHPMCAECARDGIVTAASVVDHIIPHKGDKTLFWDYDNWQPLCKPCHDRKTAREDGRWG